MGELLARKSPCFHVDNDIHRQILQEAARAAALIQILERDISSREKRKTPCTAPRAKKHRRWPVGTLRCSELWPPGSLKPQDAGPILPILLD